MVENQRVVTKVYFPRLVLPVSAALSGLVDFFIGFLVLVDSLFLTECTLHFRSFCCRSSFCLP